MEFRLWTIRKGRKFQKTSRILADTARQRTTFRFLLFPHSTFPVMVAIFNSPIALVMGISRGQASVQL